MRAFVFTDPALASRAGQFVWLAVNTEEEANADFGRSFSLDAWPSFYVVEPETERVALRWVGAMTVGQVGAFLDDARLALAGGTPSSQADRALARADRLYAEGENAEAAAVYRAALDVAPAEWPPYGRAVEALLFAYLATEDTARCVSLSREALPRLEGTPHAITVSVAGLDCALTLEKSDPTRPRAVSDGEAAVRRALADPGALVAADDRSSAYLYLVRARRDVGDQAGARKVAEEWAAFLEGQAAAADSPEQRTVFDSHRLSAYLELGAPERAVAMLELSEGDLPEDYNPPARLAIAFKALGKWDEALAASDRALAKAHGPRRVGLLLSRADILDAKGDAPAARRALEEALAFAESLPDDERAERMRSAVRERLEAATAGPAPMSP